MTARPPAGDTRWLTPGVGAVGAASFFSDAGYEVTTSVLPAFLTGTLGASAAVLGVIDGISDALTGAVKLICGPLANDPQLRTRSAAGGYLGTAVATGAIGAAATVWQVGALRATAWMFRGLRSPARDALLASLSPVSAQGRAFGLERCPACAVPGRDSRPPCSGRDRRRRARVPAALLAFRQRTRGASTRPARFARCRNSSGVGAGALVRVRQSRNDTADTSRHSTVDIAAAIGCRGDHDGDPDLCGPQLGRHVRIVGCRTVV
jgi:hypothetical protein